MVTINTGFRTSFRKKIETFCSNNNLHITYRSCLGNCDYYNIGGQITDVEKLINYVSQLELERKSKSFWHKLWN
jgi:hypothetical protein